MAKNKKEKKKVLTEEEELLTYHITKNRNRQLILVDKKALSSYILSSKDVKTVKLYYNRFLLATFLYLVVYSVLRAGEFIGLIIALLAYFICEWVYKRFFLTKLNPFKITQAEKDAFENSQDMKDYVRSTYITKGGGGLLLGVILILSLVNNGLDTSHILTTLNLVTVAALGLAGLIIGVYNLTLFFKSRTKNKE